MGYETFVVPDNIGGRYSVLTAVGLLPIAAAGIDIDEMMKGAADARAKYTSKKFSENDVMKYAAVRNFFYRNGKKIELFASYDTSVALFAEWWKQLFGESEGKTVSLFTRLLQFFHRPSFSRSAYSAGRAESYRNCSLYRQSCL